jgi:hypothetical protein
VGNIRAELEENDWVVWIGFIWLGMDTCKSSCERDSKPPISIKFSDVRNSSTGGYSKMPQFHGVSGPSFYILTVQRNTKIRQTDRQTDRRDPHLWHSFSLCKELAISSMERLAQLGTMGSMGQKP